MQMLANYDHIMIVLDPGINRTIHFGDSCVWQCCVFSDIRENMLWVGTMSQDKVTGHVETAAGSKFSFNF